MSKTDSSRRKYNPSLITKCSVALGVVAALVTIVLGIKGERQLAITTVIAGSAICVCCAFLHYHFKKINQYIVAREEEARKEIETSEEQAEKRLAVAEKQAQEQIAATQKQAEEQIAAIEKQIEVREAAVLALHELAIACAHRDDFVNSKTKDFDDEIIDKAVFFGSIYGSGEDFLYHVCEHIVNVFRTLFPSTIDGKRVRLWTGVRHLDEEKNAYVTIKRSSDCSLQVREKNTINIPVDRGIPKLVKEKYHHDGKGVVITSPRSRDHHPQPNDTLDENESMMAAPIVIGTEIPTIIILNSNIHNLFGKRLEPYMLCCTSIFTISLKNMLKSLK